MYVVANRVYVAPSWRQAFEDRFRRRAGSIETQPGFTRLEVLRPDDDRSPFVVLTAWESREAFEAWVGSEDFRAAHRDPLPKEAFTAPSEMERHQVVIQAGR